MIGARCWFELDGQPVSGLIVEDGRLYNADTWVVKLDKPRPFRFTDGTSTDHTHAAPPKAAVTLES